MAMTPMIERTEDIGRGDDKVVDHTPRCWRCSRVLIDYCTRPWGRIDMQKVQGEEQQQSAALHRLRLHEGRWPALRQFVRRCLQLLPDRTNSALSRCPLEYGAEFM